MPVDGHEWFAGKTDEEIRALIPMQMTGLAPADYEKFISSVPARREGGRRSERPAGEHLV